MRRILSDDRMREEVGKNAQKSIYRSKEDAARDVRERYERIITDYGKTH